MSKEMIAQINNAFEEFKAANDKMQEEVKKYGEATGETKGLVEKLQAKIDELEVKMQRVNTAPGSTKTNEEKELETKAMMDYMRKGIIPETKALSTDSDPEGGYMIPDVMETTIIERIRDFSPVRSVATVSTISTGTALKIPREGTADFDGGWVGERQSRPETDTGDFEMIRIPVNEMYAMPKATQQLIDDPAFGFEGYINRKIANKFARLEGYAFINGDGVNKPKGLLASDQVTEITDGLDFDALITIQGQLRNEYGINAAWMMNRFTLAYIRTLKDSNGQYLWQPSTQVGKPNVILGDAYYIADDMPNALSGSSLVTGATPILYGDYAAGYRIVDKKGIRILRDPYTSKPNVLFYTTKQVGGDVINDQAILKLKLS